jgi:hypothetical protein
VMLVAVVRATIGACSPQARQSFKLTKLTQMFTDGLLISYSLRAQNTSRVLFKYAKSVAEVSINE